MERIAALCALGAMTAATAAPATETDGIYAKAFAAAKEKGKPVLIVYTMPTDCPICINARNYALGHRDTRGVRARFVVSEVLISRGDERYSAYRKKFPGCYYPFWVAATPEGRYLDGGDCKTINAPDGHWVKRLSAVAAKHPPCPKAARQAAEEILARAAEDLEAQQFADVHAACAKLKRLWFPETLVAKRDELDAAVLATAEERKAEAAKLIEAGKQLDAALLYDKTARQFTERLPVGREAAKSRDALLAKHPRHREQFLKLQHAAEARELLDRGKRLWEAGRLPRARTVYGLIVSRYADTPQADEARKALKKLGAPPADPAPAAGASDALAEKPDPAAAEKRARSLISMARNYRNVRMHEKALAKLRRCIADHPDTAAAEEAKDLIEKWQAD